MSATIILVLRLALSAVLYIFLGWALYTLWRDLKIQQDILATRQFPVVRLTIEVDQESQLQRFTSHEITIGRDPICECALSSETVSARHARLSFHHGQWWVEDMESRNGTYLNNERVSTPTVVVQNDQLRCGDVLLTVELEKPVH